MTKNYDKLVSCFKKKLSAPDADVNDVYYIEALGSKKLRDKIFFEFLQDKNVADRFSELYENDKEWQEKLWNDAELEEFQVYLLSIH